MAPHALGIAQPDGHDHADELVRLAVGRLQRVELRHPRVLRGVQLREHLVQRLLEREVPVLLVVVHGAESTDPRYAAAARKTAIVISSSSGLKSTVTGMPTRSSSSGVPSMLVITRGPSSSSTTAAT